MHLLAKCQCGWWDSPGTPGWPFFMPLQAATATPQSPSLSFSSIPRHDLSFFMTWKRETSDK